MKSVTDGCTDGGTEGISIVPPNSLRGTTIYQIWGMAEPNGYIHHTQNIQIYWFTFVVVAITLYINIEKSGVQKYTKVLL